MRIGLVVVGLLLVAITYREEYRTTSNREQAAVWLQQIDVLLAYPPATSRHEFDVAAIDALREQLGLEPYMKL